jgi:hypothetical protein
MEMVRFASAIFNDDRMDRRVRRANASDNPRLESAPSLVR